MNNYVAHKTPEVEQWPLEHPRLPAHFTPTSTSWLNLVVVWLGIIERQALHQTDVASVAELNQRIRAIVTDWNNRRHPSCEPGPGAGSQRKAITQPPQKEPLQAAILPLSNQ